MSGPFEQVVKCALCGGRKSLKEIDDEPWGSVFSFHTSDGESGGVVPGVVVAGSDINPNDAWQLGLCVECVTAIAHHHTTELDPFKDDRRKAVETVGQR